MNQCVKHILGMLSMFLSIFISLYVFFACCSISNTLWCIFFKNRSLHFRVKFSDFTFADFVYTVESISIKRTFVSGHYIRQTLSGAPNENFAFETWCKANTGTKKQFS